MPVEKQDQLVHLNKPDVRHAIFSADHQQEAFLNLYKMVFPDWDTIEQIDGWPTTNKKTAETIMSWFIKYDKEHHPKVLAGGLWMNSGWGTEYDVELDDFVVLVSCEVIYKEDDNG